MTSDQFVYWLQGFFELSGEYKLTEKQVEMIKSHLKLVFINVTDCKLEEQKVVEDNKKEQIESEVPSKNLKNTFRTFFQRPARYC